MARENENDKVDLGEFGGGDPKIEPDDFSGDTAIVTITEAERVTFQQDDKDKVGIKLRFEETGDKVLFLATKGDVAVLVDRLGDRPSKWIGERIVIEKVIRKYRGKEYEKIAPAPADDWDDVFKSARGGRSGAKTAKRAKR